MSGYVYILSSGMRGTLYIGVTSDLTRRVWQHKQGFVAGHAREYGANRLVWYEVHDSMYSAISREKALKKWRRAWKVRLIEEGNRWWADLYGGLG